MGYEDKKQKTLMFVQYLSIIVMPGTIASCVRPGTRFLARSDVFLAVTQLLKEPPQSGG
jgi:hypothetical protein